METSDFKSINKSSQMPEEMRDELLWKMAKKRAGFKWSFLMYILVNTMLIGIWYFTSSGDENHFWPIWPILGWGLGIAIQYFEAYQSNNFFSVQNEYEKLKNKSSN